MQERTREMLEAENAKLKEQIKALRQAQARSLDAISRERLRSNGLFLQIEELQSITEQYQTIINTLKTVWEEGNRCRCGCLQPISQPKTGRKRKFFSEACRKRYNRRMKKLKEVEKKYNKIKRNPVTSEKNENA